MKVQPLTVEQLEAELQSYEDRYGTASENLASAFTHETADFRTWSTLYAAYKAAQTK